MSWLTDLLSQGTAPAGLAPQQLEELLGLKRRGGVGSDYAASRNAPPAPGADPADINAAVPGPEMMPAPAPPVAGSGIGSDFAASGGVGLLSAPPSRGIGSDFVASGMPPSTNDPMSREPVLFKDGIPLPRPKPNDLGGAGETEPSPMAIGKPGEGALPQTASPTVGTAPKGAAPDSGATMGGILGKIFNPANAPLLLAMGGGFAGAPSFGTGMRRGFSAAAPQAALLRREQVLQDAQTATTKALRAKGVPEAEIAAAVLNPEIMKGTISKYFETKPLSVHDVTGPLGDKTPLVFDPNTGKFRDMSGKVIGSETGTGGADMNSVMPPGKKYDDTLTGDAYRDQFNKDVQAAAKAYIAGDVLPTGNPRQRTIAEFAKKVAQRWGQDTGVPVSDALFSERRKYRTELGSNSATSAGGQAKAFGQGIEHADALATKLEKLGNVDPLGVPAVAHGLNWFRENFSTKQKGLADEARTIGQTLAGEVGKLFSGSAGGGVHEREMTRERFKTIASPAELAGALEGTIETMEGGLKALEQRRDAVLGPNNDVNFVTKETQAKIDRIKEVIGRLKGGTAAPAAAAAPAAPAATLAPGKYVFDPASGKMVPQP